MKKTNEDNLRELYNAKSQFLALASHQLRTPQGIIKWSMELLLGDRDLQLNPRQMQLLNQISKANKQMIDLIDTLLKITRTNLEKNPNNTKQTKKLGVKKDEM